MWTGTGIQSSTAAADAATQNGVARLGLGIILNDQDQIPGNGNPRLTTFDGMTVGENDIIIKYTWLGDTDLNGRVEQADIDHYLDLAQGIVPWTPENLYYGGLWFDTDYDGVNVHDIIAAIDAFAKAPERNPL